MGENYSPELVEKKSKQRLALRKEYLKQFTDPHHEKIGHIFDPAVQKYMSMRATKIDFFRETPASIRKGVAYLLIPIAGTIYAFYKTRTEKEAQLRAGLVSYKDRDYKFQ